jgi:hypothetical protein
MTETPDERRPRLNEDEPDVEGHKFRHGPEDVSDAERRPRLNEDDDEGVDVEGRRPR